MLAAWIWGTIICRVRATVAISEAIVSIITLPIRLTLIISIASYYPAQGYYDQSYNQEYEQPDNSYYSSNNDNPAAQSQLAQRQGAFQTTAQRSGRDRNDSRELNMAYLAYQSDGAPGEGVGALGSTVSVPAGTLAMRPPLVATLVWTIVGILLIVLLIIVIVKLLRTTATLSSVGKGPLK